MVAWEGKRKCWCEGVQGVRLKKASGKRRMILCMYEYATFYVNLENNKKKPSSVFLYDQFVVAYHPKI